MFVACSADCGGCGSAQVGDLEDQLHLRCDRNSSREKLLKMFLFQNNNLSLLASVRILLSSMTVLSDSIHMGSMSPSKRIHLGPSPCRLAMSRMMQLNKPSFHSLVAGLMIPYSSSLETAWDTTVYPCS